MAGGNEYTNIAKGAPVIFNPVGCHCACAALKIILFEWVLSAAYMPA